MEFDSSIGVGIVGLGGIGTHHAERLVDHDVTLVGGVDVAEAPRREFEERFDRPAYESADRIYEEADAVLITTPNRFHEEYAIEALEAGLDVLLEKPLAHTLASAERIAEAAERSSGFCMVGFNNRFANPIEVIKHYQGEGRFGEIVHVEANYIRRRGIPGRGSWFTSKDVAGGGSVIDIGVHAIDLSLYFLGYPEIVEVSAVTRSQFGGREDYAYVEMWGEDTGPEGFDVDDSASAFIRAADGRTISLEVAWATNRPANDEFFLRGSDGGAHFDRGSQELTIYESDDGGSDHLSNTRIETRANDTHRSEQAFFLEHVAAGTAPEQNTIEEALTVQRVIDAIYRSSDAGAAVAVED